MDLGLRDKVAVITGAGDGIGRGMARRFAAEGAKVLVAEIDEHTGAAVAEELTSEFGTRARFVRTDVGVKEQVIAMIDAARDEWGTVHILVNNAWGGGTISRVENKTDADLAHGLSIGFYGPFWAMQAALPPFGVYAALADVDGKTYIGVTNVGFRPTLHEGGGPTVETLLLDFAGDLYGQEMTLRLYRFLRPTREMGSLAEVERQVERDAEAARRLLGGSREAR